MEDKRAMDRKKPIRGKRAKTKKKPILEKRARVAKKPTEDKRTKGLNLMPTSPITQTLDNNSETLTPAAGPGEAWHSLAQHSRIGGPEGHLRYNG